MQDLHENHACDWSFLLKYYFNNNNKKFQFPEEIFKKLSKNLQIGPF